jgi:hypothetical protein
MLAFMESARASAGSEPEPPPSSSRDLLGIDQFPVHHLPTDSHSTDGPAVPHPAGIGRAKQSFDFS